MAMENDALKKISELEANKDIAGLEDIKMTAEAGFEGDIAGAAEQAIARLSGKAAETSTNSPVQEKQVEELGGSKEEVGKRTEAVDTQIKTVEADAEQKIKEVENNGDKSKEQTENILTEQEKDQIKSEFATKLYAHNIEGAAETLAKLNEKDRASVTGIIAEHLRVNNMRQGSEESSKKALEQLSGVVSPEVIENAKSKALFAETTYDTENPVSAIQRAQKTYDIADKDVEGTFNKGYQVSLGEMKASQAKELEDWKSDFQQKIEATTDEKKKAELKTQLENKLTETQKEFDIKNNKYGIEAGKKINQAIDAILVQNKGAYAEASFSLKNSAEKWNPKGQELEKYRKELSNRLGYEISGRHANTLLQQVYEREFKK